jgi:hypothetical protein
MVGMYGDEAAVGMINLIVALFDGGLLAPNRAGRKSFCY